MMNEMIAQSQKIISKFENKVLARMQRRIEDDIDLIKEISGKKFPITIEIDRDSITIKNEFNWIEIFKHDRGTGEYRYEERLDYISNLDTLKYLHYKLDTEYNKLAEAELKKMKYSLKNMR